MALRLTILLSGLIFLTLYLVGDGEMNRTAALEGTPETDVPPDTQARLQTDSGSPASEETSDTSAERSAVADAEYGAPEALPDDEEGTPPSRPSEQPTPGRQSASARADEIRARVAAEMAGDVPAAEAPPIDPDAPSLRNLSEGVEDALQEARGTGVAAADGDTYAVVTATAVNLRAGPSTAEAVVGRVGEGDRVVYLGDPVEGWSTIENPQTGDTVYMASRFLDRVEN